jgi:hypothetical protein
MSDSDRYVRSSSGLWKLNELGKPEVAIAESPRPHAPTKDRATAFAELARADFEKGNFASAETNFRLAVTFAPNDPRLRNELKKVVETRDAARRSPGPRSKK